jgi:hypothetical protein
MPELTPQAQAQPKFSLWIQLEQSFLSMFKGRDIIREGAAQTGNVPTPELTPQAQAQQIADLSRWIQLEQSFLSMLKEAGCNDRESEALMNQEEN